MLLLLTPCFQKRQSDCDASAQTSLDLVKENVNGLYSSTKGLTVTLVN